MKSHPTPILRLRAILAESYGLADEAGRLRRAADALKNLQECGDRAEKLMHEGELLRLKREAGRGRREGIAS